MSLTLLLLSHRGREIAECTGARRGAKQGLCPSAFFSIPQDWGNKGVEITYGGRPDPSREDATERDGRTVCLASLSKLAQLSLVLDIPATIAYGMYQLY
jgi:hypothetical protein